MRLKNQRCVPAEQERETTPSTQGPVIVISFPRSGSSLLRAMLHNHPEIAILPEPYWMMGFMRALENDRRPLTTDLARWYLATLVPDHWYKVAKLTPEDVARFLPSGPLSKTTLVSAIGWAYARRFGKGRWGVKYPGVEFRRGVPLLHRYFPNATFIYLARDVRDIYLSQLTAKLRPGLSDLYLYCFLWTLQARKILRDFRNIGPCTLIIRYEDLIQAPRPVLDDVCRIAGLSNSTESIENMLNYQRNLEPSIRRNPIHHNLLRPVLSDNRRKFVDQLSSVHIRRTDMLSAAVLKRFGYPDLGSSADVQDYLAVPFQVALRMCVNLYGWWRGKTTISGILVEKLIRPEP